MTIASMINLSEDALICDLAETYHIYDYRSLPLKLAATLSAGLRDDSRIKLLAAGVSVPLDTFLRAYIADRVELFRYSFFTGSDKRQPASIVDALISSKEKKAAGFRTPEEFNAAYIRIVGE